MGRPPRPVGAGLTYHVTARGNSKRRIFTDDGDRSRFMAGLARVCRRDEWTCLGYCLMGNHFHLAVTTAHANLPAGMRDLLGPYAWWFNRRHGRTDHLFGKRHHTTLVETEAQLLAALRYIARNPTRGGLASHPAGWPWSSYAALVGLAPAPGFFEPSIVLAHLDPDPARARTALVELVEERRPIPTELPAPA